MRRTLPALALVLAACGTTTTQQYLGEQEGYIAHSGFVLSTTLSNPRVKKLKDGTAYIVGPDGGTVVLYNEERTQFGKRRNERTYELREGDQFINARPLSFVLIRR